MSIDRAFDFKPLSSNLLFWPPLPLIFQVTIVELYIRSRVLEPGLESSEIGLNSTLGIQCLLQQSVIYTVSIIQEAVIPAIYEDKYVEDAEASLDLPAHSRSEGQRCYHSTKDGSHVVVSFDKLRG